MRKLVPWVKALFAVVVIAGVTYLSFYYASPYARTWDEVDFALALDRYDLLAMQPHFPGYPYFILGGWILHRWVSDPVQALAAFNTIATLSSAVPMVLLARRLTCGGFKSLLLPALVLTSPYLWLMSSRPMSESAGMAMLWWFLWSIHYALGRPLSLSRHTLVLFLFGLLMGTRLSFFPFGLALLPLWIALGKASHRRWARLAYSAVMMLLFQCMWVTGLVLSEGSLLGFWKLSVAFVEGHFSEWGGGVLSTPMPVGERVVQLLGRNLFGASLTGGSTLVGVVLLLVFVVSLPVWLKNHTTSNETHTYIIWLVACALLYTLWALFGQNIEKPRHIVPVAAPMLLLLFVAVMKTLERTTHRLVSRLAYLMFIALIVTQFGTGVKLLKQQAYEEPAVHQLHQYMSKQNGLLILFTWEETRVLQYLGAKYDHRRIYTYGYFLSVVEANPNRRVLVTDHVLQGFEDQGKSIREHVRKISEFESIPLFDPVYGKIVLYEWVRS